MMQGEYKNGVMTLFDTVYSAPRGSSPFEYFPMQALDDPSTGYELFDDFFCNNTTKTTDLWQVVKGTGGAIALSSALSGGWIKVPTAASQHDYQAFATQEPWFQLAANCPIAFEVVVNVTEANTNNAQWFVGLTSTTSTGFISNAGAPPSSYSGAVFYKPGGGLALNFQTSNGTTQTTSSSIATVVSGTSYVLGCALLPGAVATGTAQVLYWVATSAANVRTPIVTAAATTLALTSLSNMYFMFGINAGSASAETLTLDYVQACGVRYDQ
jgi:hypothetical protein